MNGQIAQSARQDQTAHTCVQVDLGLHSPKNSAMVANGRKKLNSLPDDKILDYSKLKAFAVDKLNVTQKLNFVMG